MDFRAIGIERIAWSTPRPPLPGSNTRSSKATYGGIATNKVVVQSPPGRCMLSPAPSFGPGARGLVLAMGSSPVVDQFEQFVRAVELSASSSLGIPVCQSIRTIDGGILSTTAFDDTVWFGPDGSLEEPPMRGSFDAATCLLELTGAWISDASWGLKWRLTQVKRLDGKRIDACIISFTD